MDLGVQRIPDQDRLWEWADPMSRIQSKGNQQIIWHNDWFFQLLSITQPYKLFWSSWSADDWTSSKCQVCIALWLLQSEHWMADDADKPKYHQCRTNSKHHKRPGQLQYQQCIKRTAMGWEQSPAADQRSWDPMRASGQQDSAVCWIVLHCCEQYEGNWKSS